MWFVLAKQAVQEARFLLIPGIDNLGQYGEVVVFDEVLRLLGNLGRLAIHGFINESELDALIDGVPESF